MKPYLISLASYNTWAHKKIENLIELAGEERCLMVQKSSFPTIRETLIHIWDAQTIWLDRLHGLEITTWPGKTFNGSTLEAATQLVINSEVWVDVVDSLEEKNLKRPVVYTNIKGEEFSNTWSQIIGHVMNHSTYHRGQLVTMLRGAGLTGLTSTDMITFFREQAQE